MNNIKALKEKLSVLEAENMKIVETAVNETRGLKAEEKTRKEEIAEEIRGLEEMIEMANSMRFNPANKVVEKEENKMDNGLKGIDRELRGLTDVLRGVDSEYSREIRNANNSINGVTLPTGAGTGENIIPTSISDQILTALEQHSDIFARVRKFNSATGNLDLPARLTRGEGGFVGENQALQAITMKYEIVTLTQKRVGAFMQITRQLILDSAFDINSQVIEVLTEKMAHAIEKAIFQGLTSNKEFDGINNHIKTTTVKPTEIEIAKQRLIRRMETSTAGVITPDDLMRTYQALPQKFRASARWTMTPDVYEAIVLLKDGNGNFILQNSVVNGEPMETLWGKAVEVTEEMVEEANAKKIQLYFGDLGACYTMVVKQGITMRRVNSDTNSVLNATELVAIDAHMDGTVDNPQTVVALCAKSETE